MNTSTYTTITGIVFTIVALLHLLRIVSSESVLIDGWQLPMTFNWVGFIITGFLAYHGFRLSRSPQLK
ncbi:MAG: hypothetical protein ISR82_05285 [Candidatus Marinimicrobia bacterium]|nr:hypothetical protein [Candidatus Neomarinimicrobiota bacterium]MBL7010614.1 hypothetical protein [Candidatus Neomarinimicrobiota bacterium]MBL7030099.1 hypothetical protein [Candidatus Neomarinimicrobiota bacterium]